MKKFFAGFLLVLAALTVSARGIADNAKQDTNEVKNLYFRAFDVRLTDPGLTIKYADQALTLAKSLDFDKGIAEAYRIKGLGEYYQGSSEKAIDNYLSALTYFKKSNNVIGEVRIYNNIGSLYQDIDFDQCINYLNMALKTYEAKKLNENIVLSSIYLNLGNVYQREKNFSKAINSYDKSYAAASRANNAELITIVLQNEGAIYFGLGNKDKAKDYFTRASSKAKSLDLNQPVAEIDLNLAELYLSTDNYDDAAKALNEGKAYAMQLKSEKLNRLYLASYYKLETKRKNYERALSYLRQLYEQDSLRYNSNSSAALSIYQVKYKQEQLQLTKDKLELENGRYTQRQKYNVLLALALGFIIVLLIGNVKRKAETNKRLTELNDEISVQKDYLNRVNHHLEEIIDERTKDLQLKNKKLSEYSSYLSHQIRGPIATLKGLLNLEREGLIGDEECIEMMRKCVNEIDDKIVDISDMLHNPQRAGL